MFCMMYKFKGGGVGRTQFESSWEKQYGSPGEYCASYIKEGKEGREMLYELTAWLPNGGNGNEGKDLRMWLEGLNSEVKDGKQSFMSCGLEGAESKKQFLMRHVEQAVETREIVIGNLTKEFVLKLSDDAELK